MAVAWPHLSENTALLDDPERLGTVLTVIGVVGVVAALTVGIIGWVLAGIGIRTVAETIEPVDAIVTDVADLVEASQVMVERTVEAVDSIETATRSAARTLESVATVVTDTGDLIETDLADGLESAVGALPGLIDTASVVDTTMRALSIIGVEYDPAVPLDESLRVLEESLEPIPEQLRTQARSLGDVESGLVQISTDAGSLAAVLLEARIEMMQAEQLLVDAAENVALAASNLAVIRDDLPTYETVARLVVIATAIALLASASAPLVIGLHYRRRDQAESP